MDSNQFLEYLENPFNIDPSRIQHLRNLSEDNPSCQPISFIIARCFLEQNHHDYEKYSKKAIALATNRKVFSDYISGKQNPLRPNTLLFKTNFDKNYSSLKEEGNVLELISDWQVFSGERIAENFSITKSKHEQLIDRFIKEEPRITSPRKDLPKENLAEKKQELHQELVTETLANIFAQQGFLSEAIDIFKKLSLKNPEKSSYFAKKIENLKNQLKT